MKNKMNNEQTEEAASVTFAEKPGHEQIIDLIVKKDDVTWKTILLELVNSNRMDPWNIDIKLLTKEYLSIMKKLKKHDGHDFRISGKMILAAALLLKLKSSRLLEGDINALDQLLASTQESPEDEDDLGMVDELLPQNVQEIEMQKLIPRTPQPRKRKVSIYDLVDALEKALEVKERRIMRRMPTLEVEVPKKRPDVSTLMDHLFERIEHLYNASKPQVFFDDLVPGQTPEDKVITFIPLLHLDALKKVHLKQQQHFGPIQVNLNNQELEAEIAKELDEQDKTK